MTDTYTVFDFETTGLSPQQHEIIQLGAVKFDGTDNHEIARFNQLVRPVRSQVSYRISELTGILPSDLTGQPTIAETLPDFLAFISGSPLVAHNAPFDVSFLYQAIIDCGIHDVEHFRVYDTLAEAKKLLKMPNYRLSTFKDLLGITLRSHDALNDCLITAKLYQYLRNLE